MKRLFQSIALAAVTMVFFSCNNQNKGFEWKWIDRETESEIIEISRIGKNFIVEVNDNKYPAQIAGGLLEISFDLPAKAMLDESYNLIFDGDEYIRYEHSVLARIEGIWEIEDGGWRLVGPCIKIAVSDDGKLLLEPGSLDDDGFRKEDNSDIRRSYIKNGVMYGKVSGYVGHSPYMTLDFEIKLDGPRLVYKEYYDDKEYYHDGTEFIREFKKVK